MKHTEHNQIFEEINQQTTKRQALGYAVEMYKAGPMSTDNFMKLVDKIYNFLNNKPVTNE